MRRTIWGVLTAAALVTASAAPASAGCGIFGGCGFQVGYGYTYGHGGYDDFGYAPYARLPNPTGTYLPAPRPQLAQYYRVDQGPSYSGPGVFAPYPTYQETAVRGWTGFERGVYIPYDGGPYGNAINHYSYDAPAGHGPVITSYRWHGGRSYRPHARSFGIHPGMRHHHARAAGYRIAGPGVVVATRLNATRHEYRRTPRRAY